MIAWFTSMLAIPILMVLWSITYFGIMIAVCIIAVVLATLITGVVLFVTYCRGIFYDRRRSEANIA